MSKLYVKFDSTKAGAVQSVSAQIHFEKQDSQAPSRFQTLGKAYYMFDALTAYKPDQLNIAKTYFLNALIQSGWSLEVAQLLLLQADWKDRMFSAWFGVDEKERLIAATLDYDVYQNFWPNLDFCDPGFDAVSLDWVDRELNDESDSKNTPWDETIH